jgi:hypothetical protein
MQRTYKFRLRDRPAAELSWRARAINVAWNCGNAMHKKARSRRKWLNWHDLQQPAADAARNILAIELNNLKGGGHV